MVNETGIISALACVGRFAVGVGSYSSIIMVQSKVQEIKGFIIFNLFGEFYVSMFIIDIFLK